MEEKDNSDYLRSVDTCSGGGRQVPYSDMLPVK